MKSSGGKSTQTEGRTAHVSLGLFKTVQLVAGTGKINRNQLYQSVIDNLTWRMPESDLIQMLKPMNKRFWPRERNALILYGENEVRALAKMLGEPAREVFEEFRDWKLQDRAPGRNLEKICTASRTCLPTSAECERGFSTVNDTNSAIGCVKTASHCRSFFWTLMDSHWSFNPMPLITSWIKEGHRPSTSWISGRAAKEADPRPLWLILC